MPFAPDQPSAGSETLPLFPLGTAVFPGSLLPLQIFELRYLQMIGECERQGTRFGVVTLTRGGEVYQPGGPAEQFETIGTRMRLEKVQNPPPAAPLPLAGGYLLLCMSFGGGMLAARRHARGE